MELIKTNDPICGYCTSLHSTDPCGSFFIIFYLLLYAVCTKVILRPGGRQWETGSLKLNCLTGYSNELINICTGGLV